MVSPIFVICLVLDAALRTSGKIIINTWAGPFTAATEKGYSIMNDLQGSCLDAIEVCQLLTISLSRMTSVIILVNLTIGRMHYV
mmetsp:Transcript_8006/g.13565  ORF Transcript_8006/g.13565 Transcript_8006/m.13565 type:complete len:84 (+) Transcript_8006:478-729(+)